MDPLHLVLPKTAYPERCLFIRRTDYTSCKLFFILQYQESGYWVSPFTQKHSVCLEKLNTPKDSDYEGLCVSQCLCSQVCFIVPLLCSHCSKILSA